MANTVRNDEDGPRPRSQVVRKMEPWFSVFRQSWRDVLAFDRSQVTAIPAIRSTLGFVLPLAIGVATGHIVEGVSIAGGAASVGTVGITYAYRARTRTLLFACIAIAASAFVGSITSRVGWLSILAVGLWGFGAGMLVAISPGATAIGIQGVLALIILTHFELDPLSALLQAALMFAGALLQTLLVIIPSPLKIAIPERVALVDAYQKLAGYAEPGSEDTSWQVGNAFLEAHSTLSDSDQRRSANRILGELLETAEQIRLGLIVLRRVRQQMERKQESATAGEKELQQQLERVMQVAARELREAAYAMQSHLALKHRHPDQRPKGLLDELRRQSAAYANEEQVQRMLTYSTVLYQQLNKVRILVQAQKQVHSHLTVFMNTRQVQQAKEQLNDTLATLRANLTPRSTTFRHALRMGIALSIATALYRLLPLPIARGYWIPLTVLLVLLPNFTSTFTRGIARFIGTILGAVFMSLLITVLAPSKETLVLIDALMAFLAFSLLFANYALFSAFTTIETVLLITFITPQPLETAAYRAIDTALGGLLAWLVYLLLPTWERTQVPGNIAERIEALRADFDAVMAAYVSPEKYNRNLLQERRQEASLARSNVEASVRRSMKEPRRIDTELVQGILDAINGLARAILALDAHLQSVHSRHAHPELALFVSRVDEALDLLATSIRQEQRLPPLPNLEEPLYALEHQHRSGATRRAGTQTGLSVVIPEAKRIVHSIDTLRNLLIDTPLYER